jgi:hypothetical protein
MIIHIYAKVSNNIIYINTMKKIAAPPNLKSCIRPWFISGSKDYHSTVEYGPFISGSKDYHSTVDYGPFISGS